VLFGSTGSTGTVMESDDGGNCCRETKYAICLVCLWEVRWIMLVWEGQRSSTVLVQSITDQSIQT
jgi:hypothetical protein